MGRHAEALRGEWAVVTGASSGLGREFAVQLARLGMNVVAAARRTDRLEALKQEIEGGGTRVMPVTVDLATDDGVRDLYRVVTEAGLEPVVLVNNAGFGLHGDFLAIDWERERSMLTLDIVSLVHLTRLFASDMAARGRGYIVQVASIAAYQSAPRYASYAAAKAFVLHYGGAVHHELRGSGVAVTVLSPGVTSTEFQEVADQEPTLYTRLAVMPADRVVRSGLRAMVRRRMTVVPGLFNKVSMAAVRLIPRSVAARAARAMMR